jgi:anthranilate synthase/aminodeoxychorismate synthase-like glutamine amidotransferase
MLLLIDNYDSFTWNLYQYLCQLGQEVKVVRNNRLTLEDIEKLAPAGIVVSPGPSTPLNAGISNDAIRAFGPRLPVLGVCLGHQCLGHVYGGRVVQSPRIMHGKASDIHHEGLGLMAGLPSPFSAIRYHSLMVSREGLPDCLEVTAWTDDSTVMGLRHREHLVEGVQFHPESFMTGQGMNILRNFTARLAPVAVGGHR